MSSPPTSLQARLSKDDPRLYNCNRDVAHNFHGVMTCVMGRLRNRVWPELEEILEDAGCTDQDLADAVEALCVFAAGTKDNMLLDFKDQLEQSGWFQTPGAAQAAVMATMGTVFLGYVYAGLREATLGGEGPALGLVDLAASGKEAAEFMATPKWKRGWVQRWKRWTAAFRTLRGQS